MRSSLYSVLVLTTFLIVLRIEAFIIVPKNHGVIRLPQDECIRLGLKKDTTADKDKDNDTHRRSSTLRRRSYVYPDKSGYRDHATTKEEEQESVLSRKHFLVSSATTTAFLALPFPPCLAQEDPPQNDPSPSTSSAMNNSNDIRKQKILVLGGTGFVGSRVVQVLSDMGIETITTSRNGRNGTIALDFVDNEQQKQQQQVALLERLSSQCTAVISCVGAIGTKDDKTVNAATGLAARAAKAAGVKRFVYITVDPQVQEFAREVDFLQDYMDGKATSRRAVLEEFQEDAILIEPTFIYGGGSFELNPPRVATFYGKLIEGILSSSPIRNVERILSPGIVKIALEPPVPVEDVANAAVAGALGETTLSILDSYDKIKQASAQLSQ